LSAVCICAKVQDPFGVEKPVLRIFASGRIRKTNLDLTEEMLRELDDLADSLNVSRQAVIKVILRQALDQHRLAQQCSVSAKKDKGPGDRQTPSSRLHELEADLIPIERNTGRGSKRTAKPDVVLQGDNHSANSLAVFRQFLLDIAHVP